MRITYNDVKLYQKCPLLYKNFRKDPLPENQDIIDKVLRSGFYRIFIREMELGYPPSFKAVTNGIGKYIKELRTSGYTLRQINNIQIILKSAYDMYVKDISVNYSAIAINLEIYLRHSDSYYLDKLPLILIDRNKKLLPVFDIQDGGHRKDNRIRFASAVIKTMFNCPVEAYGILDFNQRKGISAIRYSLNMNEVDRAETELRNILSLMSSGLQTPNTENCQSCEFISRCKL